MVFNFFLPLLLNLITGTSGGILAPLNMLGIIDTSAAAIRRALGIDTVNECSDAYANGGYFAMAVELIGGFGSVVKNVVKNIAQKASMAERLFVASAGKKATAFGEKDLIYGIQKDGMLRAFSKGKGRILGDHSGPYQAGFSSWIDYSKDTMIKTLRNNNKIHFNLDGIDLKQVLGKVGEHSASTTSQELRFLRENWSSFKNNVIFYKGGTQVSSPF